MRSPAVSPPLLRGFFFFSTRARPALPGCCAPTCRGRQFRRQQAVQPRRSPSGQRGARREAHPRLGEGIDTRGRPKPPAASRGAAERRLAASKGSSALGLCPNRRYALVAPRYYGRQFTSSATLLAILGRAKGHDLQAARGPRRLGAYAVRLCAFAYWRSCRWRARACQRSPLVQRTSLLSLRLGMASSPLRGLVYAVRLWSLIAAGAPASRGSQAPA